MDICIIASVIQMSMAQSAEFVWSVRDAPSQTSPQMERTSGSFLDGHKF